jgi:hypothetical protein
VYQNNRSRGRRFSKYYLRFMKYQLSNEMEYTYRGDRFTRDQLKGARCKAVRNNRGKCIRGRNSNMLVRFEDGTTVNVLARQLRKL